ncbi:MAG: 23S rRNA (uracil(1939)-C(5))-methyltransferase RlmD [Bacteroidales bacterium]|nr:23S rRNA (uracil(1939)-C(5))-methyltransferase RlmD [Bacteroidales bacterium]
MQMKKRKFPLLESLEITGIGSDGKALGRHDNKVVFIPFVVPGDVVDVQVLKRKKNYEEGVAVRFHKYSERRIEPPCTHFGICGGCKWQNMEYDDQCRYKQQQVEDNLVRIGHLDIPRIEPIIASDKIFFYRNKLEYSFNNRRWLFDNERDTEKEPNANGLGFHLPGLWDRILDIKKCYLQEEPSNAIRLALKSYAIENGLSFYDQRRKEGFLRNVLIRNTVSSQWMVMMIFGYEDRTQREALLDFILEQFPTLTSLVYTINEKTNDTYSDLAFFPYKTQDYIVEEMGNLKFRVGPTSFYQTNHDQVLKLYGVVRDFAALTGDEIVYDLYTGTGTIANFVADKAKQVVGIEYIEDAVKDARINSEWNKIENTLFYAGDMAKVLTPDFVLQNGTPDVIITDPPRSGMHEKVVEQIIQIRPKRIVYVSCNPATQARDLALMKDFYKIVKIQPFDMFPHTHHVENVALLEVKR